MINVKLKDKPIPPAVTSIMAFAIAKAVLPNARVFPIAVAAGLFYLYQKGVAIEKE